MNAPIRSQVEITADANAERFRIPAPALAVGLAIVGILAIHWQTAASIVSIWMRSETFAHCFVVVPLCLWLVWRRRAELATTPAIPWWPSICAVFAAGGLWLVSTVANVAVIQQFALAFMIQAAIVAIVGKAVTRIILFPLLFLLFAIPFGEIFVPTLIDWTADFTVSALQLTGVPVYREGNHFSIPSGAWSVVEACSGIRYLIASVMVGVIFAVIAYRSTRRRIIFIAASILVPIVANWLRAYMIVMIGHLSNNKYAIGVDHLIYGWGFFGLVMLLLYWIGSFWQEDLPAPGQKRPSDQPPSLNPRSRSVGLVIAAAGAAVIVAGVWRPLEAYVEARQGGGAPIMAPVVGGHGWITSADAPSAWRPRYKGYAGDLQQTFQKGEARVGLYVAYYSQQGAEREFVTSANQLVLPEDTHWKLVGRKSATVEWERRPVGVELVELSSATAKLDVLQLYWVDGLVTASPYVATARLAWAKLAGRDDDSALVVAYAPITRSGGDAEGTLREFVADLSPEIARMLANARTAKR